MGNTSVKASSKSNSSNDDANILVLTDTFNEHAKIFDNNSKYINEDGFTTSLFSKVPSFGKILYKKVSKDYQNVDLNDFIKMSNQFSCPSISHSYESQINLYLNIFCTDHLIKMQDYSELVRAAMDASRATARMSLSEILFDRPLKAFLTTPFDEFFKIDNKNKDADSSNNLSATGSDSNSVTIDFLSLYLKNNLPNIFKDLHDHVVYRLFKRTSFKKQLSGALTESSPPKNSLVDACTAGDSIIGFPSLWLLSLFCPMSFIPHSESGNSSMLARLAENNGWHLLYNSNRQGLSANGFLSRTLGYPKSSIVFLKFADRLLVLASDVEWREGSAKRGGFDSFLLQLLPSFQLLQSCKDESIFFNINNRTIKKALQYYGKVGKVEVEVDEGLSSVQFQAQNYPLDCVEVWGCGGNSSYEKYVAQKVWEKKDTQKHSNRKLKVEDWNDSPDKVLLGYGGIETDHAKRGNV